MKLIFIIAKVFFLIICYQISTISCDASNECISYGFNNTNLKCPSCNLLPKFNLDFLVDSCMKCCQPVEEEEPVVKKFAKARLEICTCKFGAYPQIQAFIKSNLPDKYSNLQIRYVQGRDPTIKLIDGSGEVKEKIYNKDDKRFKDYNEIMKIEDEMKFATVNSNIVEVIAIEKWNTDSVDEFLRTHLEQENQDYLRSNLI